jgi:hypothetical protein
MEPPRPEMDASWNFHPYIHKKWVSLNARFDADITFVENNSTKFIQKSKRQKICAFSNFSITHLLIHFYALMFCSFFNGFKISIKFCFFKTFFSEHLVLQYIILPVFANFEAKRGRNGSKKRNSFFDKWH